VTVKELIELLQRFDLALEVRTNRQGWDDPIEDRDIFIWDPGQGADHPYLLIT